MLAERWWCGGSFGKWKVDEKTRLRRSWRWEIAEGKERGCYRYAWFRIVGSGAETWFSLLIGFNADAKSVNCVIRLSRTGGALRPHQQNHSGVFNSACPLHQEDKKLSSRHGSSSFKPISREVRRYVKIELPEIHRQGLGIMDFEIREVFNRKRKDSKFKPACCQIPPKRNRAMYRKKKSKYFNKHPRLALIESIIDMLPGSYHIQLLRQASNKCRSFPIVWWHLQEKLVLSQSVKLSAYIASYLRGFAGL